MERVWITEQMNDVTGKSSWTLNKGNRLNFFDLFVFPIVVEQVTTDDITIVKRWEKHYHIKAPKGE